MDTTLVTAFVIPWVFWGVLMGLLILGQRSWVNILIIPIGITIVILAIANLSSVREAFWTSLILHLFFLIYFIASYVVFILRKHKKNK